MKEITRNFGKIAMVFSLDDHDVMVNLSNVKNEYPDFQAGKIVKRDYVIKFAEALSNSTNVPFEALIVSKQGNEGGTWVHEKIARWIAMHVDPTFGLWVDNQIEELLKTGSVSLKRMTTVDILLQSAQILKDHETRLEKNEGDIEEIKEQLPGKPIIPKYCSVLDYSGSTLYDQESEEFYDNVERIVERICEEKEYKIKYSTEFPGIKEYPKRILKIVFDSLGKDPNQIKLL